jgi:hypothetical protein
MVSESLKNLPSAHPRLAGTGCDEETTDIYGGLLRVFVLNIAFAKGRVLLPWILSKGRN